MTNKPSFDLAKQGDPQEIARLITYLIKEQEIIAFAELKQDYLEITLESTSVPPQQKNVEYIDKLMQKLACTTIHTVVVNGKQRGKNKIVWSIYIDLDDNSYFNRHQINRTINLSKKSLIIATFFSMLFTPLSYFYTRRRKAFWMFFSSSFIFLILIIFIGKILKNYPEALFFVFLIYSVLFPIIDNCLAILKARSKVKVLPKSIILILDKDSAKNNITHNYNSNNISKTIVFFLIGLSVTVGIKILQVNPSHNINSDVSVTEQTSASNVQTTEELTQENTEDNQDETNYFRYAIETATKAANLAQTAKTSDEWKTVADEWKNAIASMQSVPDSSENYVLAQDRVQQYQNNLEYSQKNANPQPKNPSVKAPEIYFQQGLNEANTAAFLAQTSKSKDEWEFVASQWEKAIENMKAVSTSDINYSKAQQRVIQYQKNLDYARLAASRAK
ncbi:hypothetical protein [Planktothrix agardhii]|uniref:hypothetical protein n=1 Tax=Planktothrix agardhii TaxID=1160 RepID=UPI0020A70780|nr:hypothetical protein [Planktothrix agardhii]CAD5980344.1 hypothetical protein NO758_04571 [Planktothrix agardhii]